MLGVTRVVNQEVQAKPGTKAGDAKDGRVVARKALLGMTQGSGNLKMLGVAGVRASSTGGER